MWREAPRGAEVSQQAEAQSQVDYSSTKTVPAVRWFLQGASQSNYNVSYCVTELLRYCVTAVSRNRVAALLRLRSALVLCSPRPHRSSRFPPPPRLSSPVRYRTCVRCVVMHTACLCKGGGICRGRPQQPARTDRQASFVCLPSITAGRAAPNVPYYSNTVAYTIRLSFVFANDTGWPAGVNQIAAHSISRSTEAPPHTMRLFCVETLLR